MAGANRFVILGSESIVVRSHLGGFLINLVTLFVVLFVIASYSGLLSIPVHIIAVLFKMIISELLLFKILIAVIDIFGVCVRPSLSLVKVPKALRKLLAKDLELFFILLFEASFVPLLQLEFVVVF